MGYSFDDREAVIHAFRHVVNMPREELSEWLETDESKSVGFKGKDGKAPISVGRLSGRRIVELLKKPRHQLDDDDFRHMRKVVGFVRRHVARRPRNPFTSRWRYSLKNWGHDPVKDLDVF